MAYNKKNKINTIVNKYIKEQLNKNFLKRKKFNILFSNFNIKSIIIKKVDIFELAKSISTNLEKIILDISKL